MKNQSRRIINQVLFVWAITIIGISIISCTDERKINGWGLDDPYNKHYDIKSLEDFRGRVVRIKEVTPMLEMSPGVALDIQENGDIIEVQICPTWFARPNEIGVKSGDRIKIKGVRAQINSHNVILASKIKKGEYFEFKVRLTKTGKPFWTMTPEELAKERRVLKE
ncbi:MAG: hypothetical protein KAQ71_11775 [Desulfobulbaceae bacterium]|jgi:hypothetical protein|nr:hypothetical protein [Desulfobulbaceae bacterium]